MNLADKLQDFANIPVGKAQLDPGAYIFNIQEEPTDEFDNDQKEYLQMVYHVVDGPPQQVEDAEFGTSPVGRTFKERLYLETKSLWKLKSLLIACGMLDRNDKTSDIARGVFDTADLVGKTFNATVAKTTSKKDGKEYTNLNYKY